MGSSDISKIKVANLMRIPTEGGDVMHALKKNESEYSNFGEAYFTWANPGSVKAWKRHSQMTMNLIVPVGNILFVFYDEKCQLREEILGTKSYKRLTVPPGLWFGFKGISSEPSLILNISNIAHDPKEVDRLNLSEINYNWE